MTERLAHSARPQFGIPAQPYREHVCRVARLGYRLAHLASLRWIGDRVLFRETVRSACLLHDIGKLDEDNQRALRAWPLARLPFAHQDAGVRLLIDWQRYNAAVLVYSHHAGLPDFPAEQAKGRYAFRQPPDTDGWITTARTEKYWADYARMHDEEILGHAATFDGAPRAAPRWSSLAWRMALSCLVDADHTDTAENYRRNNGLRPAPRRWKERLASLDNYVRGLGAGAIGDPKRNALRRRVYEEARTLEATATLYECDSPVGSGKTTAVMAHLLRVAQARRLRHIFVVLPFTNIIDQSVEVYRRALVLDGENPERVVAAHHHQADFASTDLRHLATLWDCPLTVTTAVQFFETLASNRPARLRKLHQLAGSAIFIDEAHAAIPAHLWPVTWKWLRELIREWGCHIVLASGSLARFWQEKAFCSPPENLSNLLPQVLRDELAAAESRRIRYERKSDALNVETLLEFVRLLPGPRVVVLNTVQTAAVIALGARRAGGDVLHISTALAPRDRHKVIACVKRRLQNPRDTDWTLVATSCIEAGVDFSFRNAVRELSATTSVVQLGGRANRHGDSEWASSMVWVVSFADARLTNNPSIGSPSRVLDRLFREGAVAALNASDLCTSALRLEMSEADISAGANRLERADSSGKYKETSQLYRVIDEDSVAAVVDVDVAKRIEAGERLSPYDVVAASVRVSRNKIEKFKLMPLAMADDLYCWTLPYDPEFLGYMEGVVGAGIAVG